MSMTYHNGQENRTIYSKILGNGYNLYGGYPQGPEGHFRGNNKKTIVVTFAKTKAILAILVGNWWDTI